MKHVILLFLFVLSVIYAIGCKSNTTGPLDSNVTFAMSSGAGTTGTIFAFKPSVDVKLTRVIVSLPSQPFFDTLTDAGTYVYSKDTVYNISEYTGVTTGQQWKFYFTGSTTSNSAFTDATANYTVP